MARWHGPIAFENVMTGDGRLIKPDALRWSDLPLPLQWARASLGGHDGAVVVGHIDTLQRQGGGVIWGEGDFDLGSDDGREAFRQVRQKLTNGISVDLDEVSFEIQVAQDLLDDLEPEVEATPKKADDDGRVVVMEIAADSEVMATTDARVRGATLVALPAFAGATIQVDDSADSGGGTDASTTGTDPAGNPCSCDQAAADYDPDCDCGQTMTEEAALAAPRTEAGLIAAAVPLAPPGAWFADPKLSAPTPLVVTEQGRVYGHLATWGSCHTAYPGQCVSPPSSRSGYAYFRTGSVRLDDGTTVPVGHITMGTGHATPKTSVLATMAHYENTGTAVADVAAGEDAHGIWVAGALRPRISEEQVRTLRASPLSGDWRMIGGHLELVAALAVNVPGFPVPHPAGLAASGVTVALVASGMLPPRRVRVSELSEEDLVTLKRLAAQQRASLRSQAADLNARVQAHTLARRVHQKEGSSHRM